VERSGAEASSGLRTEEEVGGERERECDCVEGAVADE